MPIRTNRGRAAVYRRLWGWPMRSPRHLVISLLVIGIVVTAVGLIVPQLTGSGDRSRDAAANLGGGSARTSAAGAPGSQNTGVAKTPFAPASPPTSSLPTRLPAPPQTPISAPPAPEALDVATRWGKAWVTHPDGTTTEQWLAGLKPYTTDEYVAVMQSVNPANISATEVTGPAVATSSFTSSVEVNLPTNGGMLSITVIQTPQGWRVAKYEQAG
jgi:hypothetical protein